MISRSCGSLVFYSESECAQLSQDALVPILTDTCSVLYNSQYVRCSVRLSKSFLTYRLLQELHGTTQRRDKKNDPLKVISTVDIINCYVGEKSTSAPSMEGKCAAYIDIVAYPFKKGRERQRKVITFSIDKFPTLEQNLATARMWTDAIVAIVKPQMASKERKPLLFVVNPASGRGRALRIFQNRVRPLLEDSGTKFELLITEAANHAMDFIKAADLLNSWSACVVVSGDGLLYEVLNGIMQRGDSVNAVNKMPLGVIPGGSGNGLAHSIIYDLNSKRYRSRDVVFESTVNVIRGKEIPMDLVRVETRDQIYYSFLSIGWGLMSDIDIESERLRVIGGTRFAVWSVYRCLRLRKYHGRLSYLAADSGENEMVSLPPLDQPVPSTWVTMEGDIVNIYASYQTHISHNCMYAPDAEFQDGVMWLGILKGGVNKSQIIRFLLAMDKGTHTSMSFVEWVAVRAFRLEPTKNAGRLTIDGELVPCGPVQAQVIPSLAKILTR